MQTLVIVGRRWLRRASGVVNRDIAHEPHLAAALTSYWGLVLTRGSGGRRRCTSAFR
jgi:hypothetical protein